MQTVYECFHWDLEITSTFCLSLIEHIFCERLQMDVWMEPNSTVDSYVITVQVASLSLSDCHWSQVCWAWSWSTSWLPTSVFKPDSRSFKLWLKLLGNKVGVNWCKIEDCNYEKLRLKALPIRSLSCLAPDIYVCVCVCLRVCVYVCMCPHVCVCVPACVLQCKALTWPSPDIMQVFNFWKIDTLLN